MALPTLTNEQRMAALEKATQTRKERAEIRKKISNGRMSINDVFTMSDNGNEVVGKMRIMQMLMSFPTVGPIKAERIADSCGISHSRRVKGVGANQRRKLIEALG